jgi:hypothetical protein
LTSISSVKLTKSNSAPPTFLAEFGLYKKSGICVMWMHAGAGCSSACTENAGVALDGRRRLIICTCIGCAGLLKTRAVPNFFSDSDSGNLMAIGNPYGPSQ